VNHGDRQSDPETRAGTSGRPEEDAGRHARRWASALAGAVVFAVITASFGLVVGLGRREAAPSRHPTAHVNAQPGQTASATPTASPYPGKPIAPPYTPPPTAQVTSTVTAPAPLIITSDPSQQMTLTSPVRFLARDYQGQLVGTITVDQAAEANGVLASPDGSKLLVGSRLVFDVYGHQLSDLYTAADASALVQPIWADDSEHLCGITYDSDAEVATGALLEFSASGGYRTVADLGPLAGSENGWLVLACSPSSDRAIVWQSEGSETEYLVIRLSTGQVVATYPGSTSDQGPGAASHDGSLLAIDGADGISILDTATGQDLATVVRWGESEGYQLIGDALAFSWDGSRLLVQSDIAQGGPRWIVDWADGRDLVTTQTVMSLGDVIPLTSGATIFIQETGSPYGAFFLANDGTLQTLPVAS
jgi:hypothetical protein